MVRDFIFHINVLQPTNHFNERHETPPATLARKLPGMKDTQHERPLRCRGHHRVFYLSHCIFPRMNKEDRKYKVRSCHSRGRSLRIGRWTSSTEVKSSSKDDRELHCRALCRVVYNHFRFKVNITLVFYVKYLYYILHCIAQLILNPLQVLLLIRIRKNINVSGRVFYYIRLTMDTST